MLNDVFDHSEKRKLRFVKFFSQKNATTAIFRTIVYGGLYSIPFNPAVRLPASGSLQGAPFSPS